MLSNSERVFERELSDLTPHLRAFARTFEKQPADADDLAQEALSKALKARASFQPGTNLRAWLFMILRNVFYSEKRRSWRSQPMSDEMAGSLSTPAVATDALDLADVRRAMFQLPLDQREALTLIGAAGLSYEDASEILGCPIGTVKSRVSRARDGLRSLLDGAVLEFECDVSPQDVMAAFADDARRLVAA